MNIRLENIQRFLAPLRYNFKLKIGVSIFLLLLMLGIFEPIINKFIIGGKNPIEIGLFKPLLPPSISHILGTDMWGRDTFAMLIAGLKYSLTIGLLAGAISTLIGVVMALLSGYKGGIWDVSLNGFTNLMLVIPSWPILAIIAAYVRKIDIVTMSILLAIFSWPVAARTIRAQVLSLKERAYVDLARITGLSDLEIIFLEIMPGLLPYIGVGFANSTIGAILAETGLELIGLSPGNIVTLGLIVYWCMQWGVLSLGYPHLILAPILCLVLIFLSLNLINIGLDEVYNPRLKKITGM